MTGSSDDSDLSESNTRDNNEDNDLSLSESDSQVESIDNSNVIQLIPQIIPQTIMPISSGNAWLGGKPPRSPKHNSDDIFGLGLSVSKTERAELKKSDKKTYYKVRENCVKGIPNKFTQLKSIDENSPVEHFESVYSVVTRFDDLQETL